MRITLSSSHSAVREKSDNLATKSIHNETDSILPMSRGRSPLSDQNLRINPSQRMLTACHAPNNIGKPSPMIVAIVRLRFTPNTRQITP